jgi:hypothetical protein
MFMIVSVGKICILMTDLMISLIRKKSIERATLVLFYIIEK